MAFGLDGMAEHMMSVARVECLTWKFTGVAEGEQFTLVAMATWLADMSSEPTGDTAAIF